MALETKTDLIKEIEVFSKALYDYRNIGALIIPEKEYNPYYAENGYLKRADYNDVILDEDAFLSFYTVFFDSIKLSSNAENVSDSEYFNTLYHGYKAKYEKETSNLDTFMKIVTKNKEKEYTPTQEGDERYTAIEKFLYLVLKRTVRKKIKSKTSYGELLFQIAKKEDNNQDNRKITFVLSSLVLIIAAIFWTIAGVNPMSIVLIGVSVVFLLGYTISSLTVNKLRKSEKEELNQLPKNFKTYLLGYNITFNEEFFSPQISSYLDSFFKGSTIYPYVKAKYTKKESENGIINE